MLVILDLLAQKVHHIKCNYKIQCLVGKLRYWNLDFFFFPLSLSPPATQTVPDGDWFCPNCRPKEVRPSPRKGRQAYIAESDDSDDSEEEEEEEEEDENEEQSDEDDDDDEDDDEEEESEDSR